MIQNRALYSTSEISSAVAISKYGREIGENEGMVERERIHTITGMAVERILSSQRKHILLLIHVVQQTVPKRLFFQQEVQGTSKNNIQRSPLDKVGCSAKISGTGLISDLWEIFLLLSIIKNLQNVMAENCCSVLPSPVYL